MACGEEVTSWRDVVSSVTEAPSTTLASGYFGAGFNWAQLPSWMCDGRDPGPAPVTCISTRSFPPPRFVRVAVPVMPESFWLDRLSVMLCPWPDQSLAV